MSAGWTRLCAEADLPEGAARVFDAAGISLAAARSGSRVFVLENICSHDDGPLGEGRVVAGPGATGAPGTPGSPEADGPEIECPRHGGRFGLATGRATRMPAVTPIRAFPAKIEAGGVWVDLPEDLG